MNLLRTFPSLLAFGLCAAFAAGAEPTRKSYTNADFYRHGVFQKDVARKAVKQLMAQHGLTVTPQVEKQLWVSDFGLGDYEHVGLASVTWLNDAEEGYFAMTMYLLPGQMIPEHIHRPITDAPARAAKHESWRIIKGSIYNFSEIGEPTPNPPRLAAAFDGKTKSRHYDVLGPDDTARLKQTETYHFMRAGNAGAIVDEYGVNHDRRGWSSSHPSAHP